jgi:hypothetical protein
MICAQTRSAFVMLKGNRYPPRYPSAGRFFPDRALKTKMK